MESPVLDKRVSLVFSPSALTALYPSPREVRR